MTDDTDEIKPRSRRPSSVPVLLPTSTSDESNSTSTIATLVTSNPLIEPSSSIASTTSISSRTRRRSSASILQALVHANHLLATNDARKRNFLVGSGQQLSQNVTDDISSCFPNGRLLTVMVATWNTGEAKKLYEQNFTPTARRTAQPKERMLDDMCDILLPTFIDYVSDLIIICTQEMSASKNSIDWEILLQEVIGPTHVLFHSAHFGTLSLCIFLRRDLIWFCTEPEEDIIKFRAMNPLRTKASIAITFNLFGTSFMIINSHFEAGDSPEDRSNRRLNFQHTITKLKIPQDFVQRTVLSNKHITNLVKSETLKRSESTASLDSAGNTGADMTKSCDCVLWAGDMNFRIDMTYQEVLDHCKESRYSKILLKDEFCTVKHKTGDSYADFKEADIDFPPTYKFDLNSVDEVYAKQRTPSYTDRILYRDKSTSPIQCTQYKSIPGVRHSDHKPVIAHFHIKLKPGLYNGCPSYGKFNYEVYRRGCEKREQHHSLGIGFNNNIKRRPAVAKSSVCVLQ